MCLYVKKPFIVAGAVLSLCFFASLGRADEKYYMTLFAYEGTPNLPRLAHTFATFVKAAENGDAPKDKRILETHTISWLAATLKVRVLVPTPEPGVNLDLTKTLELARSQNARVTAFGPYRIKKELYDRALAQIKRLNSGAVAFKAVDGALRPNGATNCFHAVSDIADAPLLNTGTAFGVPATIMVRDHLSPWILDQDKSAGWLAEAMGLQKYPITFQVAQKKVK